ncbi:hypothetical protein AVEN_88724-1 [Araneus ventricosus]|uniref:Uncharacterized protein n=1 Tax=Araneus ventricosus TaxID=182803 RepID=A0A4Y2ICN3_ARAVE|nr:hypothetical protein AVEN_264666-1 [Araneus ventricosus]GBM75471.1 hypothetical protein AVEN_88724-1 [Araneus ventricosus]
MPKCRACHTLTVQQGIWSRLQKHFDNDGPWADCSEILVGSFATLAPEQLAAQETLCDALEGSPDGFPVRFG